MSFASARPSFLVGVSALALLSLPAQAADQPPGAPRVGEDAAIESILVVGTKADAAKLAGAASVLDEEDLATFEYNDVLRVLRQVPGVNIQEEDGFGLRPNIGLRGTTVERSQKINLMEDGVLIAPAPYAAPEAYYFPTMGRMSGVEVRKGSSAIEFGPHTVGGTINVLSTPIPEEPSGRLEARAGSFDLYQIHAYAGGKVDGWGALAETYQTGTSGFKKLDGGGDTGFTIKDYMLKLGYETPGTAARPQSFVLKLSLTDQNGNESYMGLADEDFAKTPYRRYAASARDQINSKHRQAQFTHFIELTPDFDVTTVAYYNDFSRDWEKVDDLNLGDGRGRISPSVVFADPTDPLNAAALAVLRGEADSPDNAIQLRHNDRDYYAWGVQSVAHWRFETGAAAHELELSARYHVDEEDRLQNRDNFAMRSGVLVPTSSDPFGSNANRVQTGKAWAFYLADRMAWGDWAVTPGVRVETMRLSRIDFAATDPARANGPTGRRENDITVVLPGVGATYQWSEALLFLASAHRGFSPPSPSEQDAIPEKSVNYEAGLRYNAAPFFFEAIGFFSDYSNVLGTCTNSVGCTVGDIGDQFNGGAVNAMGVELSGGTDIALGDGLSLPLRFNYTFTDASFRQDFSSAFFGDVQRGDKMPYIPRQQGYVSAGLAADKWDVVVSANYVGKVRTEAGQGAIPALERVDARTVFDLAAGYDIARGVRLFFSIENLFDKTYAVARRPYGLRPGKPQSFIGGIGISF
ncbi:MAG: TonB-dependent receptor family protein [Pseudomonadota bacterium]